MDDALRILVLGDEEGLVDLIDYELSKFNLRFTSVHVTSLKAFLRALNESSPDLILASTQGGGFNGLTAMALAQEVCPAVPFFFVDGLTYPEEPVGDRQEPQAGPIPLGGRLPRDSGSGSLWPAGGAWIGRQEALPPLLQITDVVIAFLSPEGLILEFNQGAERLTGWRRHEVLGKDGREVFFPETEWAVATDLLQRVLSGNPADGLTIPLKARNGTTRACRWFCTLLAGRQGQPAGIMVVGQYLAEPKPRQRVLGACPARTYPQPVIGRGLLTHRTGSC